MGNEKPVEGSDVLLVKIRPSANLRGIAGRVDLEPLHDDPAPGERGFGLASEPQWYLARLADGAETPWDQAHSRVAEQMGIAESDVLFAEPDLVHRVFIDGAEPAAEPTALAISDKCEAWPQDGDNGKAVGPDQFAWHLGNGYSGLGAARSEVEFKDPRTRIAHLDTGYYAEHETVPKHLMDELEWNFVGKDGKPSSASDPDNWLPILDNSGHGTGTLSILAGREVSAHGGQVMGGAPDAEVVPIRVADSVVLLRTSALARALRYAARINCQVATLSMGGVPTRAWGEAVDAAYEAGLCLCAAAGNHVSFLPPSKLVYPARYDRVIAVCGVMADGKPYANLEGKTLEGSFGPQSAMRFALAAYTPNIPWARYACRNVVRLNGEGTSSATPQVAAAAALWIEKHKHVLPNNWRRVEAVRHALFSSAKYKSNAKHFGQGVLQARRALAVEPVLDLPKSDKSDSSFGFLRVLTGLGVDGPTAREEMLNIELAQRWMLSEELQEIVPDPAAADELPPERLRRFMEAVIEDKQASVALRRHVVKRYRVAAHQPVPGSDSLDELDPPLPRVGVDAPEVPDPPYRRIRVYATDPSLSSRLETAETSEVTLPVRWEKLKAGRNGPEGEYVKIEDRGPSNYSGVNLNNSHLLAQDGWRPSEGNPQFHQQMVYAVTMKTIEHFEQALGRPVLWSPRPNPSNKADDSHFVRRLEIRPHALQQANAFYSPQEVALLFGYFRAPAAPGHNLPGSPIYTCLSHDIIAHEATHAILDGMYRRFNEPTNPDVLAFHEGFADVVALLQHFTMPELLEAEIARTRGNLEAESLLGKLAVQFGRASSGRSSLRSAIGSVENGEWKRRRPDPERLARTTTPHARGAVLVAAVFDSLLAIYNQRVADLLRIATGGSGVLPGGDIHPDLVGRLASEAAKSARHVLTMCIRGLDYLPPVDVTFFDFLRALITADYEMVNDDQHNYRVAFVENFSRHGIFPGEHDEQSHDGARALSVDTLRWPAFSRFEISPDVRTEVLEHYHKILESLKVYADACLYLRDRKKLFERARAERQALHGRLSAAFKIAPQFAHSLNIDPDKPFEVHTLRRAMRTRMDGRAAPQIFVSLIQSETVREEGTPRHRFRGGVTVVVDLAEPPGGDASRNGDDESQELRLPLPKYQIAKRLKSRGRRRAASAFVRKIDGDPLLRLFFSTDRDEPFAALHDLADDGA